MKNSNVIYGDQSADGYTYIYIPTKIGVKRSGGLE